MRLLLWGLIFVNATVAFGQHDSVAVYNNRAFDSFTKNDYRSSLYWTEKVFSSGLKDYQNNYNFYRAAVSACQVGQPGKALDYYTKMAGIYLDYSNYTYFAADSSKLDCIRDSEVWKRSMAYMKIKYDSLQTLNQHYFEGITDTTRRLNCSLLLNGAYLDHLFEAKSFDKVYLTLKKFAHYQEPPVLNHWTLYQIPVNDTLTVPFLVYIPKNYRSSKPTPLYIFLQGAVRGRPEFMVKGRVPVYDAPVLNRAIDAEAFIIYPFARKDVNWLYHDIAFQAILKEIAFVKSLYNIDDNKVYLAGHSNGGEGAFNFAINQPTPFASFLAFTYFPQAYITNTSLRNLMNTRTFHGITASRDHIFDAKKIDSIYHYAREIGCNWQNYTMDGNHTLPYSSSSKVGFAYDSLFSKVRAPFPSAVKWETDDVRNGRCDWIEINALDTIRAQAPWIEVYNPPVSNKDNKGEIDFNPRKTGVIEASIKDNQVLVRTSWVSQFSFYVYPELVDINRPLSFVINGKPARLVRIKKDKAHLKSEFLELKDRILLPIEKITLSVE